MEGIDICAPATKSQNKISVKSALSRVKEVHVAVIISWIMKGVMAASLFYFAWHGDFLFVFLTILCIIASLLPSILERSYKMTLPWEIDFVITLVIFLHLVFGDVLNWYVRVPYYDKFLHFFSTGLIAFTAFMIVFGLHYSGKVRLSVSLVGFFTVVFTMAIGVLWEIGEFAVDQFFHVHAQAGLEDTMWDLILDTLGGMVAAVFGMLYVRRLKPIEKRILSIPIAMAWERMRGRIRPRKRRNKGR